MTGIVEFLWTKNHSRRSGSLVRWCQMFASAGVLLAGVINPGTAAASNVTQATILEIAIDPAYGNFVFIRLSIAPSGTACAASSYWHYTLSFSNTAALQTYGALLAAQMAGKTISVTGTATCNEWNSVESLRGLNVQS